MESVREWAAAVCCACVIGALLSMVYPNGSSKRLLGTVITLMMMCIMFRPVVSIKDWASDLKNCSFDISRYENPELEDEIKTNAEGIYSSYIRQNLCRVLDASGISYERIDVITDNSQEGCISIERVEVIVKSEDADKSYRIRKLLRDHIGFEPEVRAQTQKGSE